ncbi:MAG TPA: CheR family methyltransferase [Candidatus Thermoplasmatota archaeon]|nr:CheR family methyltransferase [Candidatus Thermoplasmatota archaeon]
MSGNAEPTGFVCLGASAGGLRSLEAVLRGLTPRLAWPVLIAQHMQPDHPSHLAEILARATSLEVREAVEGEKVLPARVYVCPASSEMGVSAEGRITLRPPVAGPPQRIDHLFASASFARPGLVVAVVLSGTGTDGAAGSLVVKLNGGTVLAESAASALYDGMPRAAGLTGTVDAVRDADALAPIIESLAGGALRESADSNERVLREITRILSQETTTDFEGYKLATVRRRVEKRRAVTGSADIAAYRDLVLRDAAERDALIQSLLIPVTEFFRDPEAWRSVASNVLPHMVERAHAGEKVRVWCAGCATGEEAYTIALLLAESLDDTSALEIVGTDLDAKALARARAGVYDPARVRHVSAARLQRFFEALPDHTVRVRDEIRRLVRFEPGDLTREAPPGTFDLVICRNVLIYFDEALQVKVVRRLRNAMRDDGALLLGRSEAIARHEDTFAHDGGPFRVFRAASDDPRDTAVPSEEKPMVRVRGTQGANDLASIELRDSDAMLLVLDGSWRITASNPRADEFFQTKLAGGSLLDLLPAWQDSPVHDALRTCIATGRSVRVLRAPARGAKLDLTIEPFPPGARTLLLVAHKTRERSFPLVPTHPTTETQLRADLEATNDELQATNEELASANEELQASNEELASLNEEFQSTNETLASMNAELRAGGGAAPEKLLQAIVLRSREALVACDPAGRIAVFNDAAARILGLKEDAVGRPLEALGIPPATVRSWLDASTDAAGQTIERSAGGVRFSIEHLRLDERESLGWVLTCRRSPA